MSEVLGIYFYEYSGVHFLSLCERAQLRRIRPLFYWVPFAEDCVVFNLKFRRQ